MKRSTINGIQLWQYDILLSLDNVRHFVSDRNSLGKEHEFTLSYTTAPHRSIVDQNRDSLARAFHLTPSQLFFPRQVHRDHIVRVTSQTTPEELAETDALITNERNLFLSVLSADCVTILLYDIKNKAIGAIHSGWRGTVARILMKTLTTMHTEFSTQGKDVIACIGPSVCQDSYEVGGEVIQEVKQAFPAYENLLIPVHPEKAKLDLWIGQERFHAASGARCRSADHQAFDSACWVRYPGTSSRSSPDRHAPVS